MALTSLLPDFLVTKLDYIASMLRKHSLWPMPVCNGMLWH